MIYLLHFSQFYCLKLFQRIGYILIVWKIDLGKRIVICITLFSFDISIHCSSVYVTNFLLTRLIWLPFEYASSLFLMLFFVFFVSFVWWIILFSISKGNYSEFFKMKFYIKSNLLLIKRQCLNISCNFFTCTESS